MGEGILVFREIEGQNNQLDGAVVARILPISATPIRKALSTLSDGNIEEIKLGLSAKFLYRLGYDELFSLHVWRASMAELLGTALLVFLIDTVVISSFETSTKTPNIVISCFVALLFTFILLATAPILGGHINPVITLLAALVGQISYSRAMVYMVAQIIGAVVGASALVAVVSNTISSTYSLGGCTLTVIAPGPIGPTMVGIETGQALRLEIFCTFIFLFAVWMAFDCRQSKALGPLVVSSVIGIVVGLTVFVSTTVTTMKRGYSGAGINPARCIGPAIVRGGHLWAGHWVFWVGPVIACIGFYLYTLIIPKEHFKSRVIKE